MKIFITGSNGFLGQHLTLYLAKRKFDVIASGRGECRIPSKKQFVYHSVELTNSDEVSQTFEKYHPDIIIHTAAMSKPDECNNNKESCIQNNVEATKYLVVAAKKINAKFIYTSTDFIFGENGPHKEDDIPAPLNFYGESKLQAEEIVKTSGLNYTIVRPVFIYGNIWQGLRPSFLHWVKNNLEQGKKIKVVSDQLRTPTYVNDICAAIENIILQNTAGAFHLAGKDIVSPYEMALTVAKVLQLDATLIENVTSSTFPEPVARAKRSGLIIEKAVAQLNYSHASFEEGVKLTFDIH
jgi:dTDP-4-dehydrorhamnose reductase